MVEGRVFTLGTKNPREFVEQYQKECAASDCRKTIAMAQDEFGKWHPFDPDTGVSHYSTCVAAERFRNQARRKAEGERL